MSGRVTTQSADALRGKRALVMGLGVHGGGLGVARWLLRQGAEVTVTDTASREALAAPIAALDEAAGALGATVAYTLGEHRAEDFQSHELVVVNPAVRPDSPWLALAAESGAAVETEMTLFFRACRGTILGVTGTKGKTTTALLLAAMLRERYPDVVAAGNLRVSALEALEGIGPATPVVLELSSFQLERLGAAGLSPRMSLITNLSPDHLNWHGTLEAYAAAKRQIYWHQPADGAVALNGCDDASAEYCTLWDEGLNRRGGRPIWVAAGPSWSRERSRYPHRVLRAVPTTVERRGGVVIWSDLAGAFGARTPLAGEPLFSPEDLRVPGAHNLYNAMAAAALARAYGVDGEGIRAAIRGFEGVEHRLELVRELDGVRYVNDTTATNPAAALAALAATAPPIVLIAGGADKELEFAALGAAIARSVKGLVLLAGSATPRLLEAVAACGTGTGDAALPGRSHGHIDLPATSRPVIVGPYSDFAEAVRAARELAGPGDTVLLSPGCASFGMFRNEFHRGEEFRKIVAEL
ncbi:MAG: UDP-N-acetylmuramoyl-L-alanine--D-glutamate ligase [Chloroflexi bacterium OHK40]